MMGAFLNGADGVFIGACLLGECHYTDGNYYSQARIFVAKKILSYCGIDPGRLEMRMMSSAEGGKFVRYVTEFTEAIIKLGPLGESEKLEAEELSLKLQVARNAVEGKKLRWITGKKVEFSGMGNVYGEVFTEHELGRMYDEIIMDECTIQEIVLRGKDRLVSVKGLATLLKASPQRILRELVDMRRMGMGEIERVDGKTPLWRVRGEAQALSAKLFSEAKLREGIRIDAPLNKTEGRTPEDASSRAIHAGGPGQDDPSVLVVGAGIAGIEATLELAEAGVEVYLVEQAPTIGGAMAQLDRTAPSEVPALSLLAPRIEALRQFPNIHLVTNASIEKVKGEAGAFEVVVRQEPFRVNEKCTFCGACAIVCPIKPFDTFNEGLSLRTAIDSHNWASPPHLYNIEKETPICVETCPAHVDVRTYVGLIADGKYAEAVEVVRKTNPLPAVCGRVCNHPCESACNRGKQDDAIAIDALKRFASDYEVNLRKQGKIPLPRPTRKKPDSKVAIVGSGPAGLTVAYDLAMKGRECTVFEAAPVPGGMLWLGIPEYRLPRHVIESDIEYIKALGVELRLNTPIGKDLTIDDLFKQGFRAVFLGVGAHRGLKLGVPGEDDFEGILDCVVFLRRVNLGDKKKPGEKVIVIGGGNSAIDSARTARRLGCEEVSILYRRSLREMPANSWEIEEAEREGVKIHYLAAPVKMLGKNGKVGSMICTKMRLGKLDASGRRSPIPVEGSEFEIEADCIIPAISQEPDISFLHEGHGLKISKWNSFVVGEQSMATNRAGVFAAGDCVTGPATVIQAIAAAHSAAEAIEEYLKA
jgi:NADPH-dependent glutamate synthase beta subunit-like oxidoreductase